MTEPDYQAAERELRGILASSKIEFDASPAPGSSFGEGGTLHFAFWLKKGTDEIRGEWSCGSAVPLHAYTKAPFKLPGGFGPVGILRGQRSDYLRAAKRQGSSHSIDDTAARARIRAAYRPDIFDVVSSLLNEGDYSGYIDWIEWANDFGFFDGKATTEDIRKAQADFATIQQRMPALRRMLGADYEKARDCATRL